MRIAFEFALAVSIATQVVLATGCASVPATVTRMPRSPLKADPAIFLQSTRQWPRIAKSLSDAGIQLAESYSEADYILNVKVGRSRGSRSCGGGSNVAYVLDDRGGHLMVIKGRGLTGACVPNVFDDMSQTLASYFGGWVRPEPLPSTSRTFPNDALSERTSR